MNISVAIIPVTNGEQLGDCIHSIVNQRVIKADEIRIYDSYNQADVTAIADSYKTKIIPYTQENESSKNTHMDLIRKIVDDSNDDDILILISDDSRIDPSAIRELFRYFLKYNDLAMIYGRQIADQDCNHLTRYVHNVFYPITQRNYPVWHLMRILSTFKLVAYRVKFLKQPNIMPEPETDVGDFGFLYIGGRLAEKGYRTMYNPLAISHVHRKLNAKYVYAYCRGLYRFLKMNDWLTDKWWLRQSDLETFFYNFKEYIKNYSSIPFVSFYATICFIAAKIGEMLAEIDYQRSLKRKAIDGKALIATTLFDKDEKLYK